MSLVVVIPLALGGTLDVPKRVYLSYIPRRAIHTDVVQNVLRLNSWILLSLEKVFFLPFFYSCDIHPHCVKKKNWGSLLGKLLFQDFF